MSLPDLSELSDGNGGKIPTDDLGVRELTLLNGYKLDTLLDGQRDHESRIRPLEEFQSRILGGLAVIAVLAAAFLGNHFL
jgi:hypothetical protein